MEAFCRTQELFECFLEIDDMPRYATAVGIYQNNLVTQSCDVKQEGPLERKDPFTKAIAASLNLGCPLKHLVQHPKSNEYAMVGDNQRVIEKNDADMIYSKVEKIDLVEIRNIAKEENEIVYKSAESDPEREVVVDNRGNVRDSEGPWKWQRSVAKGRYYLVPAYKDNKSTVGFFIPYYFVIVSKMGIVFLRWEPKNGQR
ncbi:hypothetical protein FOL47_011190 [Perkinsus chesapeaki]|uniref:Uncharacterized protein n=1 Tax=Perkinsus chesapeaki TaxID=330153 RepID=A0A7J6KYM7_PERCH|nr:hypothetical protein FOL47_011190 [Perkinsus chesapeaki]